MEVQMITRVHQMGGGCYYNATGLNNYENIPEYWRSEIGGEDT